MPTTQESSSNSPQHNISVDLLRSGRLWSIVNGQQGGVILQKKYYAEYIGPGAAIGGQLDSECVDVYLIGDVELDVPRTTEMRRSAYQQRIENIEQMQEICEMNSPTQRGMEALKMLIRKFSLEEIQAIPNTVLAKLVGVVPTTISVAWQNFLAKHENSMASSLFCQATAV